MKTEQAALTVAATITISAIIGILMFIWGHANGADDAREQMSPPRTVEAHAKHTEIRGVRRGLKLLACGQCGVVFDPQHAGIVTSDETWERIWKRMEFGEDF